MIGMLIAEKTIDNDALIKLCKAVLKAQDIKEDSWEDGMHFYKINGQEAAIEAGFAFELDDFWSDVIQYWNHNYWNVVQGWAQDILNREEI